MDDKVHRLAAQVKIVPGLMYHAMLARNFFHNPCFYSNTKTDNVRPSRSGTQERAWMSREATNGAASLNWDLVCVDPSQVNWGLDGTCLLESTGSASLQARLSALSSH